MKGGAPIPEKKIISQPKKEKNLIEIAEELGTIINKMENKIAIGNLLDCLKSILADIYTAINQEKKNEKTEKNKIGYGRSETENSIEKDKSLENINDNQKIDVVNLDKEKIKNSQKLITSSKILPAVLDDELIVKNYTFKMVRNTLVK